MLNINASSRLQPKDLENPHKKKPTIEKKGTFELNIGVLKSNLKNIYALFRHISCSKFPLKIEFNLMLSCADRPNNIKLPNNCISCLAWTICMLKNSTEEMCSLCLL